MPQGAAPEAPVVPVPADTEGQEGTVGPEDTAGPEGSAGTAPLPGWSVSAGASRSTGQADDTRMGSQPDGVSLVSQAGLVRDHRLGYRGEQVVRRWQVVTAP